jgi:hypothetical protein
MAERPRLCVFGDSHYACIRQAEGQGLVDASGVELEYWGNVGGRFRYLVMREGAIHAPDAVVAGRFAKFNAKGRTFLPADAFEAILVMGARIYPWRVFFRLLHALSQGPFLSEGLQRRILADGLRGYHGYHLAAGLAATGTARILLAPVAHYTLNPERFSASITPAMATLIETRLGWFWSVMEEAAAEDGITLIRQPEETVVAGMFTDPAFAVANHVAKADYEHRNAAYGALILGRALALLGIPPVQGLRDPGPTATMATGTEVGC